MKELDSCGSSASSGTGKSDNSLQELWRGPARDRITINPSNHIIGDEDGYTHRNRSTREGDPLQEDS